jgi:C4-dicarboxylate-specific signal transduction histidine kinase
LRFLRLETPDLAEIQEALACIANDGRRAGEVIGRIRDQMKKAPPRRDVFDINEMIREVLDLTRGEMSKNRVSVETRLAAGLPAVQGDRVQLQQVILNLIVNAIEAMSGIHEGSRALLISTAVDSPDRLRVEVHDTGPGLAPETIERLFDPFFTTKAHGMGMGLSICQSIVEAHGGRLRAGANTPQGAVFQFTVAFGDEGASPQQTRFLAAE